MDGRPHDDDDDDADDIAYFTVRWKLESKFSLLHQTPTKTVKTENGPISRGSQSEVSMVRD